MYTDKYNKRDMFKIKRWYKGSIFIHPSYLLSIYYMLGAVMDDGVIYWWEKAGMALPPYSLYF